MMESEPATLRRFMALPKAISRPLRVDGMTRSERASPQVASRFLDTGYRFLDVEELSGGRTAPVAEAYAAILRNSGPVLESEAAGSMFVPLLLFALALMGCGAFALALSQLGRRPYPRVVAFSILGYVAAGALVWLLVPSEWTLSFPETLAASVDAKTYGHPVEHYAESLLLVMLFACVLGSAVFGTITTFGGRLVRRIS
jgi:hypothetical protein